jgi:hypothetical protein
MNYTSTYPPNPTPPITSNRSAISTSSTSIPLSCAIRVTYSCRIRSCDIDPGPPPSAALRQTCQSSWRTDLPRLSNRIPSSFPSFRSIGDMSSTAWTWMRSRLQRACVQRYGIGAFPIQFVPASLHESFIDKSSFALERLTCPIYLGVASSLERDS